MRRRGREFKGDPRPASGTQGLQQRAKQLWSDGDRAKGHGDYAHWRDQLDQVNEQQTHDCGK